MLEGESVERFNALMLLSVGSRMNASESLCVIRIKPGMNPLELLAGQIVLVSVAISAVMMPIAPLPPGQVGVVEAGDTSCRLTRIRPVVAVAVIKVGLRSWGNEMVVVVPSTVSIRVTV
jgi:hypothetical protein